MNSLKNLLNPSTLKFMLFSCLLFIVSASLHAKPNGKDLMLACKHSLAKNYSGTEGMMCTWYVTPCDCIHSESSVASQVCLPDGPDVDALALEVIEGLEAMPELLDERADVAAGVILEKAYPCAE